MAETSDGMTGGELLLRSLHAEGVRHVFAIPDGTYNVVMEAMQRLRDEIPCELVVPRHEGAAAHMADGYSRVTGTPAVVMACAGPGAANLVSGVITAQAEGSPVVAITTSRRQDIAYPHSGAMQVADQMAYFRPAVKWSAEIHDWERLPDLVRQAFRMARSGRPGPVHLQIPENVLGLRGDPAKAPVWGARAVAEATVAVPDPAALRRAAELLVEAQLPNLHFGSGARHAGAEARALAEHLGAPVTHSPGGRGTVPEDHALSIHPLCPASAAVHQNADVVLAVGARLGELDFWGRPPIWAEAGRQRLVQLDAEAAHIGMQRPVEVGLLGDARASLAALLDGVRALTPPRPPHARLAEWREAQAKWRSALDASVADEARRPVLTGSLFRIVDEELPRDAILAMDGGNTCMWGVHHHLVREPATLLWTANFGHLGTGLPYAIGARLARPERSVVCVTGDGAFGFHLQELETAARQRLPLVVVVAVDGAWGMEKTSQNRIFGRAGDWLGCEHAPVRYDKVAEAMGCHGEYAETGAEFRDALRRSLLAGCPAVIHAAVDPVANVDPPGMALWVASHAKH
jgi:acetolactate synthase-1/2/3 large subunit